MQSRRRRTRGQHRCYMPIILLLSAYALLTDSAIATPRQAARSAGFSLNRAHNSARRGAIHVGAFSDCGGLLSRACSSLARADSLRGAAACDGAAQAKAFATTGTARRARGMRLPLASRACVPRSCVPLACVRRAGVLRACVDGESVCVRQREAAAECGGDVEEGEVGRAMGRGLGRGASEGAGGGFGVSSVASEASRGADERGRAQPQPPEHGCAHGHAFVVRADLRRVVADAVLFPTRNLSNAQWFPHGAPANAQLPPPFTRERRVHRAAPAADGAPAVWLGWLFWEGGEEGAGGGGGGGGGGGSGGGAPAEWFVEAAQQFLEQAADEAEARAEAEASACDDDFDACDGRPRALPRRALPLLALPVVGTGTSGGRGQSGRVLGALLGAIHEFVRTRRVDVALVIKSRHMYSAAQAARLRHGWALGPDLNALAEEVAARAAKGELVLCIGSGVSRSVNLPGWRELLGELAVGAKLPPHEVRQLRRLALTDQAKVLQHRLGTFRLAHLDASAQQSPDSAVGSESNGRLDELQRLGTKELQRLAVERLRCDRYSVLHALLGALPHEAAVTTNCDECYDSASADAGVDVNVLPYDARTSQRWLLKLHGDVAHPEDIVLTYSSAAPYGAERQALSGMVQALLITKHMLFVGFSLRDEAFHQVGSAVRRALASSDARVGSDAVFGTALTLSHRPFMSELWPDLQCVPMGEGVADTEAQRQQRSRQLEVFLDRVCCLVANSAEHLLDADFSGAFSADDLELRAELLLLLRALQAEPRCKRPAAYALVKRMFSKLGCDTDEFL